MTILGLSIGKACEATGIVKISKDSEARSLVWLVAQVSNREYGGLDGWKMSWGTNSIPSVSRNALGALLVVAAVWVVVSSLGECDS